MLKIRIYYKALFKVLSYVLITNIFVNLYPGTSNPDPCPIGFYCLEGNGTTECPRLRYRNVTGAKTETDCFPCEPGYYCNETGISIMDDIKSLHVHWKMVNNLHLAQ